MRNKKSKYLMLILMLLSTILVKSQEKVTSLVAQDVRLLLKGSDTYKAGTLNTIFRFQAEAKQDKSGYASLFFEYEYGELAPRYTRYSINASYTFNQMFVKNFELSTYLGYGFIDRGFSKQSFGFGGSLNYQLSETFKINAVMQIVDRTDLGVLYDDRQLRTSFFVGISIDVFKTRSRK